MKKTHFIKTMASEKGAALMLAVSTMTLLLVIATEVMFETSVEYVVSSQSVNQVKAYWAARAGVEMSLLRIHIYRQALALGADKLPDPSILDEIWKQPFLWPPPIPQDASIVDGDQIKKAISASDLTALKISYLSTIESEGSKIDINDLGSPSKIMADTANKQLLQLFENKIENDESFASRFRGFNFQEILNNIADWIDADDSSRNGGSERSPYEKIGSNEFLPPNQPLRTLAELHQVAGMTDDLYALIAPAVTIYGGKGININQADKDVFKSLGTAFTDERITQILADRKDPNRGPFKDEKDFLNYLNSIGIGGNPFDLPDGEKTPLVFDPETIFQIRSTGKAGQAQSDITAIVYDADKVRTRFEKALVAQATKSTPGAENPDSDKSKSSSNSNAKPGTSNSSKTDKDSGPGNSTLRRPKIVYWNEQ